MKKSLAPVDPQIKLEPAPLQGTDKLDSEKKKLFVRLYNQLFGNISNTCLGVGIARQTYYDWLEKDELFRSLIMESEMNLNDEIREVLINKAASGDMTAVIFYLKKRHPDFKDTPQALIQNNFYERASEEADKYIK